MTPIFLYTHSTQDVWSVQPSIALAQDEALRASALQDGRFEVVIEAGDWNNPVYAHGELVAGVEN